MIPLVLDHRAESSEYRSIGTRFAPTSSDMDREQAIMVANSIAHGLGYPCRAQERDESQLYDLIRQVILSVDRQEMTEEDAREVVAVLIAADMERRFDDLFMSMLGREWSDSVRKLYTTHYGTERGSNWRIA